MGWGTHLQILFPTLGSPGCIHDPVGDIVCDPGVAGQAPRHDGVMWPVLVAELQVPGGEDGAGASAERGLGWRVQKEGSGLWAWGLQPPPHPTHASRLTEDFTHVLPMALLQHSICDMGPVKWGWGWGLASPPTPPPCTAHQDLPPACRNPHSWSRRGGEGYVRRQTPTGE